MAQYQYVNAIQIFRNDTKTELFMRLSQASPSFPNQETETPEPQTVADLVMTCELAYQLRDVLNQVLDGDSESPNSN